MSLEEFGWDILWWDFQKNSENNENQEWWKEKITQADIARIEAQAKKAKQVWQQWQQTKRNNQAIANFLTFLFRNIKDDKVLLEIHKLFFTKNNVNTGAKELKSTIYAVVLIGIFAPFFIENIKNMWLFPTFEWLLQNIQQEITTSKYISYVENLCKKYKISFIEHNSQFVSFIVEILFYFWIVDKNALEDGQKDQLFQSVKNELFKDSEQTSKHNHVHTHTHDK